MNYSAVDVSYWKELEEIAERYGYDLDEEAKEIINEYVKKYEQFDDMIWMSGETEIGFETFCRALAKKQGYHRVRQKNMLCQICIIWSMKKQ